MPSIELSAGTIDYDDTGGDGPTLVLIHGLVMSGTLWRAVVADLSAEGRFRCITPTLPLGAHRTPMHDDADLSLVGQARLIGELLERLDLHDVTLVANDWGGPQVTVVETPERIGRVALVACEAFNNIPPGLPGKFAGLAGKAPGGLFMAAQTLRLRALRRLPFTFGWMTKRGVPADMGDGWIQPLCEQRKVRRDLAKYVRTTDYDSLLNAADKLPAFQGPALVVWASEDRIMPQDHGRRLARLFPDGRLVEIADSYTLIPIDQPTELANALRELVGSPAVD